MSNGLSATSSDQTRTQTLSEARKLKVTKDMFIFLCFRRDKCNIFMCCHTAMSIKMYFVALAFIVFACDRIYANQVATMEGIGPVKIGMTVQEAERPLGAKLDPISTTFGNECWVTSRSDKKDRAIQYLVEDENIAAIDVYPPAAETFPLPIPAIKTLEGIGVDSTEEQIRRAYGKSAKKERASYFDEDNKDTVYRIHVENPAKKLGMIFDVQYGRVLNFSVGTLEAINRMEGCS